MATYRASASGQFIDQNGSSLYDPYRANAAGDFINSQGASLYGGAPASPYGGGSPAQRSMAYAASQPAASPATLAQQLRSEYKAQMEAANTANEQRYGQALGLNDELRLRQMGGVDPVTGEKKTGYFDTYGTNQKLAISQAAQSAAGDINQMAVDRGIANTSSSLNRLASAGAAAGVGIAGVEQDKLRLKNAADSQLTNDRIGLIQSKVDQQPDLNQLIQLEQMSGSGSTDGMYGGGAYGGGGGYGGGGMYGPQAMGYQIPGAYQQYPQGGGGRQEGYAYGSQAYRDLMAQKRLRNNPQVTGTVAGGMAGAARGAGRVAGAIAGIPGAIGNAVGGIGNLYGQFTGASPRRTASYTSAYPRGR